MILSRGIKDRTRPYSAVIVGNAVSVHTNKMQAIAQEYFRQTPIVDSRDFSLRSPFKLLKAIHRAKKLLKTLSPSLIILYQIDVAAFFVTLIKGNLPSLVVGIGSDVLTVADKSFFNRFLVSYVINKGSYFNAGSEVIKKKMQQLANREIDVVIANLGTDDILPAMKQNIIYSNRLHKDLYQVDKIIAAFAWFLSNENRKNWQLVIAATGKEEELMKQVKELGIKDNVKCVGWLDKQTNEYYYSISKIWVSLAQSDSISISLLEAMSAGCLPVCYDVPALEDFLFDGWNAVIVSDLNGNFFERAVNMISDDVIDKNRRKAREFSDRSRNRQNFFFIFDQAVNKQ